MDYRIGSSKARVIFGEQHCGLPGGLAEICADPDSYTSSLRHNIINLFVNMKLSGNQ